MPKILKKVPAKLVIVGDGPERKNLVGLTKELNLQDNVVFEGKIPPNELPKFYASADVFVGPSIVTAKGDTEGLGIVFLEAIASGTCVVGSKVGGIPDIIKHNETGLLVREKNPEGISRAVITILGNVKMQKRLCENALKHIQKNYSWKVVAEKFSELYGRM
jgi:glycosyltransferase involved in cell wall biosynthesis